VQLVELLVPAGLETDAAAVAEEKVGTAFASGLKPRIGGSDRPP
jgi:hypothetical protein